MGFPIPMTDKRSAGADTADGTREGVLIEYYARNHLNIYLDRIPDESLRTSIGECLNGDHYNNVSYSLTGDNFILICNDRNDKNDPGKVILSHRLSESLTGRIRQLPRYPNLQQVLPSIMYPAGGRISAKANRGKPLTLPEVGILSILAADGDRQIQAILKRGLAKLLHTSILPKPKTYQDLVEINRLLPYFLDYWPNEMATFLPQIYSFALPLIRDDSGLLYREMPAYLYHQNPEKSDKMHLARDIVRSAASSIYLAVQAVSSNPALIDFFLREIIQKPNPETISVYENIVGGYEKQFPAVLKKTAKRFFETEFDLGTAQAGFFDYFNSCPVYAKLLVFLYRKAGRIDARSALVEHMFQEISLGETAALFVYLKELVEKDRDPEAILLLKRLMINGMKALPDHARAHILFGILSLDKSYKIFEKFIRGEEYIDVEQFGRLEKRRFDLEFFARADLKPFFIPQNEAAKESGGYSSSSRDWKTYTELIGLLMKRGHYKEAMAHLDAFYADIPHDKPPWAPGIGFEAGRPLTTILVEAFSHKEMHEFLLNHAGTGNPFLGLAVLGTSTRFEEKEAPDFLSRLRHSSLDSIHNRIVWENRRYQDMMGSTATCPLDEYIDFAGELLSSGKFERSPEFAARGFNDTDLGIRHLYINRYSTLLSMSHYSSLLLKSNIKEILADDGESLTPGQKLIKDQISAIRGYLSQTDLSYIGDLIGITLAGNEPVRHVTNMAGDLPRLFKQMLLDHDNSDTLPAYEELLGVAAGIPFSCDRESTEYKTASSLDAQLYNNIFDTLMAALGKIIYAQKVESMTLDEQNSIGEYELNSLRSLTDGLSEPVKRKTEENIGKLLTIFGRLATFQNYYTDTAIGKLERIVDISPHLVPYVARTLTDIAESHGSGSLKALRLLIKIAESDDAEAPKIRSLLSNYDPIDILEGDCSSSLRPVAPVLREMVKLGNRKAYIAWRDYLVGKWWKTAENLPGVKSLQEFNTHAINTLYLDFMDMGRLATSGDGPPWLARYMASDLNNMYEDGHETIEWVASHISSLSGSDPLLAAGIETFGGEFNARVGARMLANDAGSNTLSYTWLSILAIADIPGVSSYARHAMANSAHTTPERDAIYKTFASNCAEWIYQRKDTTAGGEIPF